METSTIVGLRAGGTLLGPEGTAPWGFFFGSGFEPESYTAAPSWGGFWWVSCGFGVRWGVCELDSGCEHLAVTVCGGLFRLLLCSVCEFLWFILVCVSV